LNLVDTLTAAGMTPPQYLAEGRWLRFPGVGKGRSNRAGWCRLISPTFAIYGDWSTGLRETWSAEGHHDDDEFYRRLESARLRSHRLEERARQVQAARDAQAMIRAATPAPHPYLARKGFPERCGLVHGEHLLVPLRDERDRVVSVQTIDPVGAKRFLKGSRTRGGAHRLGIACERTALCEGYATALSLDAALKRLPGPHAVIACFSAGNLEAVAPRFPQALVCADNDFSGTGERVARATGLRWVMPPESGMDFNDLHLRDGLHAVVEVLRGH
jgi:putative DNA primase/helicase